MSTEAMESNSEVNSSQEHSSVAEKSNSLFHAAQQSFEEGDYSASLNKLEDIPEKLRDDDIKQLIERSKQLRSAGNLFQTAHRAFDAGDYDQALLTIEKIPETDRSEQCLELQKNTRMVPMVKWAREKLNQYEYEDVIELLDPVPKEDRSSELIELIQKAYTSKRRIEELHGLIETAIHDADEQCSSEMYENAIKLLEELLLLNPQNDAVEDRILEISAVKEQLKERDRLFQEAKVAFKEKEYAICEESLKKIPERIRKGDALDLLDQATAYVSRCNSIREKIINTIVESNYSPLESYFSELSELQNHAYQKIAQRLKKNLLIPTILELAKLSSQNSSVSGVLHGFLDSLDTRTVIELLHSADNSFAKYFTDDCMILVPKIQIILQELPQYSTEKNQDALKAIGSISKHLGDVEIRCHQWNHFWALLEKIFECNQIEWSNKELWFESNKTGALEFASQKLAELSEQLLKSDEEDSWTLLENLTEDNLKSTIKPIAKAFRKIKAFLSTGNWKQAPLVPLTRKRIVRGTLLFVGVTASASIVQVLMTFMFGLGGFLGFGMVFFLAGLWTATYFALNKIM